MKNKDFYGFNELFLNVLPHAGDALLSDKETPDLWGTPQYEQQLRETGRTGEYADYLLTKLRLEKTLPAYQAQELLMSAETIGTNVTQSDLNLIQQNVEQTPGVTRRLYDIQYEQTIEDEIPFVDHRTILPPATTKPNTPSLPGVTASTTTSGLSGIKPIFLLLLAGGAVAAYFVYSKMKK